jgi:hypothetical protein
MIKAEVIKVDEFILMTDEQKTKLKWTYLLEKIRFGIQVIQLKFNVKHSSDILG